MELLNFFDEYDRNARIVPGLINAIPTISTVIYCFPGVQGSAAAVVGSGLVSLSVIYLLALTVRFLGARIEPKLWEAWGGAPSTRFVRWRDQSFDETTKAHLRVAVQHVFRMQLPSRDGETENPVEADRSIEAAFKRVREYLRRAEPHGLWHKHNIEYGFARNLLGSASIFIGSAVLCCFISAICKDAATWRVTPVMLLNALYALIWTPFACFALPLMTRHAADRYAERSWLTFLEIASRDKR